MNEKIQKYLIFIVVILFLSGCTEKEKPTPIFPSEDFCMRHIKDLSCDQLQQCYDWCDKEKIIFHAAECRDGYKARIWKCYGVNKNEKKNYIKDNYNI
jgi:hypothetical protein